MYIRLPLSSRYPGALSNVLRQVTGLRELCKSKLDGSDKVCTGQTDSVNIIMWVRKIKFLTWCTHVQHSQLYMYIYVFTHLNYRLRIS